MLKKKEERNEGGRRRRRRRKPRMMEGEKGRREEKLSPCGFHSSASVGVTECSLLLLLSGA